jgi:hypothetical protein
MDCSGAAAGCSGRAAAPRPATCSGAVCVCVLSAGGPPPGLITRAAGSPSDAWYCCVLNCSAACCASSDAWPPPLAMAEGPPARAPLAAPRKGHLHPLVRQARSSGGLRSTFDPGLFRFGNKIYLVAGAVLGVHSQAGASTVLSLWDRLESEKGRHVRRRGRCSTHQKYAAELPERTGSRDLGGRRRCARRWLRAQSVTKIRSASRVTCRRWRAVAPIATPRSISLRAAARPQPQMLVLLPRACFPYPSASRAKALQGS